MNHLNSTASRPFFTSSGIEFISHNATDKRAIEQPKTSSSKRAKRKAENEKVIQEITVLIEQTKAPLITSQEVKDIENQIALKKLEELTILHGHLKEDAKKLYYQKQKNEAKVVELTQKLVSKEAEINPSLASHAQEKQELEAQVIQLTSDLMDTLGEMGLMESELSAAQLNLLMTKEELQDKQEKWEATVAQMRAQHAKELQEKDDALAVAKAVASLSNGTTKATRAKMTALVKKNKELVALSNRQNEELIALRAEKVELTETANHSEAELLVTQKATQRLLAQKHETESKYQSLLKELTCMVERRK